MKIKAIVFGSLIALVGQSHAGMPPKFSIMSDDALYACAAYAGVALAAPVLCYGAMRLGKVPMSLKTKAALGGVFASGVIAAVPVTLMGIFAYNFKINF